MEKDKVISELKELALYDYIIHLHMQSLGHENYDRVLLDIIQHQKRIIDLLRSDITATERAMKLGGGC